MGVTPIKMPQLGESVTEGTVDKWLKQEGEFVKRDEPLVEVVTDKVNAEIPSPFEGKLLKINVEAGATVPVGTEIAQIDVEGAMGVAGATAGTNAASPAAPVAPERPPTPAAPAQPARYSPAVRRLAEEHRIDVALIQGSGEGGRVTRDDVLAFIERQREAAPAPAAVAERPPRQAPAPAAPRGDREELVPLSAMRRSIAEHMVRSVTTAPHAWTLQEVDVSELVSYRETEKEGFQRRNGAPLTYLPFVIQIVCDALEAFPHLNASWTDEGILVKHYVNMGIAVAIPDGLIVPVVRDADQMGFVDLARSVHDLVSRARARQLKPEDVQGGTFTLNNTGATGSQASYPIINQPQAAILTTESITRRPIVIGDGIAIRHMMNLCLSFDHRVIDGMTAGGFLSLIKKRIESWTPASLRI